MSKRTDTSIERQISQFYHTREIRQYFMHANGLQYQSVLCQVAGGDVGTAAVTRRPLTVAADMSLGYSWGVFTCVG